MKIQIDFFSGDLISAIGGGIYKVSVKRKDGANRTLYIGESVFVLVRCASHLYGLKKNPAYFSFKPEQINDNETTLIFSLIKEESDKGKRRKVELDYIEEYKPICQSGISDRMKPIDERIEALTNFLNGANTPEDSE